LWQEATFSSIIIVRTLHPISICSRTIYYWCWMKTFKCRPTLIISLSYTSIGMHRTWLSCIYPIVIKISWRLSNTSSKTLRNTISYERKKIVFLLLVQNIHRSFELHFDYHVQRYDVKYSLNIKTKTRFNLKNFWSFYWMSTIRNNGRTSRWFRINDLM